MTVRDLIDRLQALPPDLDVCASVCTSRDAYGHPVYASTYAVPVVDLRPVEVGSGRRVLLTLNEEAGRVVATPRPPLRRHSRSV